MLNPGTLIVECLSREHIIPEILLEQRLDPTLQVFFP